MKDTVVLHHSGYDSPDPQFESVKGYHDRGANGKWPAGHGIQYPYFIEVDGHVMQGRDESEITWHAGSWHMNVRSIGICLAGDLRRHPPTGMQVQALTKLITDIQARWGIPDTQILSHRDVRQTECPGMDLIPYINKERERLLTLKLTTLIKVEKRRTGMSKNRLTRMIQRIMRYLP